MTSADVHPALPVLSIHLAAQTGLTYRTTYPSHLQRYNLSLAIAEGGPMLLTAGGRSVWSYRHRACCATTYETDQFEFDPSDPALATAATGEQGTSFQVGTAT